MEMLVGMAVISVGGMVVEKIAYECCKPNHAMYASLASSSVLGLTALQAVAKLIEFLQNFAG